MAVEAAATRATIVNRRFMISAQMLSRSDVNVAARFPLLIGLRGAVVSRHDSHGARTSCGRFLAVEVARLLAICAVVDDRVGALN